MPKRLDIQKILIIGAGPIVIGQACEFDYSGTQACRALKEEGYTVILVNSNPATIMTDPAMADKTYIEPITPEIVTKIIEKERPDAILPTMGGQTALNTAFALHKQGILQKFNVQLIGANFEAIEAAEDRECFKQIVQGVGLGMLRSETVDTLEKAKAVGMDLGFPMVIRPAFTLGGSGGAIVYTEADFETLVQSGLDASPISQVLLEESALGWKEYEFEVMRDAADNVVIVCSVENVDPMGVHTGDSITVAPAQTLSDKEFHILRNASIDIIRAVGVDAGGCNIQFAVHPDTGRVVVIEMNPRVSRSSALVSKATGVPIAKISAKLAVGFTLDEIPNDITRTTMACFEPAIDYVVTKIPRFSFEKFPGAATALSPQMKSVGEVMAIGRTFLESFQKALVGLETGFDGFSFPRRDINTQSLHHALKHPGPDRLTWVYEAIARGESLRDIYTLTGIDPWFLDSFNRLFLMEAKLRHESIDSISPDMLQTAKEAGFTDNHLGTLLKTDAKSVKAKRHQFEIHSVFKSVDTCAGEFVAVTPYFYSTYDGIENEAPDGEANLRQSVMILGGGPNRIGQGIEFDYCCVHAAFTLKELGYDAVMVNSNPETVSTDYDISDRLYFEPLTPEHMRRIIRQERPLGIIAQLGGQTPLKLAYALQHDTGKGSAPLLGSDIETIDRAEDRKKFRALLEELNLKAPESGIAFSEAEALEVARQIGFPLIARPSYVLGGQFMRIFYSETTLKQYLRDIIQVQPDFPVLIERFLESAQEVDVDAISDGKDVLIGGILEHIEHAGIHSGDSACVLPPQTLNETVLENIRIATTKLGLSLGIKGFLNIQFAIQDETLYVLEVNPRASRTVPFICKATGMPLVNWAVRIMLGQTLRQLCPDILDFGISKHNHVAVKVPVFPFNKFKDSDPKLGPEMRSTGEVMGLDSSFPLAYAKALLGAGQQLPQSGNVFISVHDRDKQAALPVAKAYSNNGFNLIATTGTAAFLEANGIAVTALKKKHEGAPNAEELLNSGQIQLVINTPAGEDAFSDDSYIRKAAVIHNIPWTTTIAGAGAMIEAIQALRESGLQVQAIQEIQLPVFTA